ncbi:MAG: sugar phosphate isomerase/epimerase [Planctomycetota bacterium]|nr:MAG: sugar phosphate isomerase/epimerase [Planctomycetota bacterium]REK22249.1 MAG: sugar phosphate isomerase/epimerase [Planctomycetota bacterium]REK27431.1 MAG: sugar phosphate isomerase/epimerase [Planctomycetota bacterium]
MTSSGDSKSQFISRRRWLTAASISAAGASLSHMPVAADSDRAAESRPFRYCFNTSCIRGQRRPLAEEVDLIAAAGYDGLEPWIDEIERFVQEGGSLPDLRKRIADAGLAVESAIGFANWIVDDDEQRAAALEKLKRDMDLVRQIGGNRIAAPPAGANAADAGKIDLFVVAERYRTILEIGREIGVTPQIEIWGPSRNLSRLGEAVFAAVESGHPDACILPDVYHIYRGGSDFDGLKLLSPAAVHVFHVNDYPTSKPREEATDADRVYPGDGDAPLGAVMQALNTAGFRGALSLELFNRSYWEQNPAEVARRGLEAMRRMTGTTA